MRGKRSKQYRKLMEQYGRSFGFREPYQVLLDADMIRDADKFKMDLLLLLERTLHGKVKPMITQCCMRHLYKLGAEPGASYIVDKAKTFERRRCDHRPEDFPEPLSAQECLASVVDPKSSKTNKHRYVVASQDLEVRKHMRSVLGVPLVYINRSVMIMEPMAGTTVQNREKEEAVKFRVGLKRGVGSLKRKREGDEGDEGEMGGETGATEEHIVETPRKKKKSVQGPKGPNPLAVKKPKKKTEGEGSKPVSGSTIEASDLATRESETAGAKRKRKRKSKAESSRGGELVNVPKNGPDNE